MNVFRNQHFDSIQIHSIHLAECATCAYVLLRTIYHAVNKLNHCTVTRAKILHGFLSQEQICFYPGASVLEFVGKLTSNSRLNTTHLMYNHNTFLGICHQHGVAIIQYLVAHAIQPQTIFIASCYRDELKQPSHFKSEVSISLFLFEVQQATIQ